MKDPALENLKKCLCQKLLSVPSQDDCKQLQKDIDECDLNIDNIIDKYIEKLNSGEVSNIDKINPNDIIEYTHFYGKRKLGALLSPDNIDAAVLTATATDDDDLYLYEAEQKYIAEHTND